MSSRDALEQMAQTRLVEQAFREQALKAQRAYAAAAGADPYSLQTDCLYKLHRESLGQWIQARKDHEAAHARWRNMYSRTWAQGKALAL